MSQLLLLEDDVSLGMTLKERLEKEGHRVFLAADIAQAKQTLVQNELDLIILDVGLPDGSGFDLARGIRKDLQELAKHRQVPLIFMTAQAGAEDRLMGYELGAEEYIPKPFHLREFLLRVQHVIQNHAPPNVMKVGEVAVDWAAMTINDGQRPTEYMSARDSQLFKLLVDASPRVVSRDEILNSIWGENRFPSTRTVDNSILRLRSQLGPHAGVCIRSVRGVGYCWSLTKLAEED